MAVSVHHSLNSKSLTFNCVNDIEQNSEFLAIEILIKPQSMVVYVSYQSVFNLEVAIKHYERVKLIMEKYRKHKIMVVGDFNLNHIACQLTTMTTMDICLTL